MRYPSATRSRAQSLRRCGACAEWPQSGVGSILDDSVFIYRLTHSKYVDTAFSGEGARRVGGRWSPTGYAAVYAASSISLAVLETLVHSDRSVMPSHHTITVEVPDSLLITVVNIEDLPDNWRDNPAPAALKRFGKSWIEAAETAILQVPSAIVPQEANYLLNPFHVDLEEMVIRDAELFAIDRRLVEP